MSRKLWIPVILFSAFILLFACLPTIAAADELTSPPTNELTPPSPDYAIGYQFSRSASGFTVKIPINEKYYIQPIFAFTLVEKAETARKNLAFGVRAVSNLPARQNFRPYAGISWGHSEGFYDNVGSSPVTIGGTGFDTFIGVEYEKYMIHPSLEIGLGSYASVDDTFLIGTTLSFSLLYYF